MINPVTVIHSLTRSCKSQPQHPSHPHHISNAPSTAYAARRASYTPRISEISYSCVLAEAAHAHAHSTSSVRNYNSTGNILRRLSNLTLHKVTCPPQADVVGSGTLHTARIRAL
ncbi:hypothetical protein K439DRAFT_409759 [Ramaria rubella]|nr:hypothetical protein K439DRAFT_409759 [Ramaria rubella]